MEVNLIIPKILECTMEACSKKICKIRNVSFIFVNVDFFLSIKKIEKIYMNSEKSKNSFDTKIRIGHLIIY